ncbi:MAG: NmrA/HSCARG family protein [Nitrospira sp.]|nr:NmrA/HSCARG family protein [Nitrospira sp.]
MAERKIIAVVGATGAQGGGLVRAIVNNPGNEFMVRALTRDLNSDKAMALKKLGAEVVSADLDDKVSLKRAFAGAYGVFCLTNFWEHFSPEKEYAQAKNQAEAAKETGVHHVIWSTLEDTRRWVPLSDNRMPTLMGRYKVPHFDSKGEADQEFSKLNLPVTFLLTSFYWDNMIFFGMGPKKGPDGGLLFVLPMADKKLPGIAVEDIGKCAFGIFKRGKEYIGKRVGIAGEHLTGTEMAAALTKAMGQPVRYNAVTPEQYRGFGFQGADDLGNMFQFKQEFNDEFCRPRDLAHSKSLNPELQSFEAWLAKNKGRIPIT